jgi:hypothetical protein
MLAEFAFNLPHLSASPLVSLKIVAPLLLSALKSSISTIGFLILQNSVPDDAQVFVVAHVCFTPSYT